MGLLNRFFNRPPSRDRFAKMVLKRIAASGDFRPVTYDREGFRLLKSAEQFVFLENFYQAYLRTETPGREQIIRGFLATWHTTERPVPEDFADVRADILPALRARSYVEVDIERASEGIKPLTVPPYTVVAEHLAATVVYDLPDSMMTVNDETLAKWGVTFYEAMEVARKNLEEKPIQLAQIGTLYTMMNGDAYDATRMLALDFIRQLEVNGDPIAMIPNRDRLHVCGSADLEAQEAMHKLTAEGLQHERYISGMAFRLDGDEWEPWLPPEDHPHCVQFHELRTQTFGEMYASQKDLLEKRYAKQGVDVFVATFSGMKNLKTGRIVSYCVWSDGVESLLPETESIALLRPNRKDDAVAAQAEWETVHQFAGEWMEPLDIYPPRWRVRSLPPEEVLQQIRNASSTN